MANETRGELAEAIAVVALERAVTAPAKVFWEQRPENALVLPDITIGADASLPSHVVLVTACDTPRSSAMKYWRDLGEIFDSKASRDAPPGVISLVFRSSIKEELIRLEGALCDSIILVDRDPSFGTLIVGWLEGHHADAPSQKGKKKILVEKALTRGDRDYNEQFTSAFKLFVKALRVSLLASKRELQPLWKLCREESKRQRATPTREPKTTLFRRGVARWVAVSPETRSVVFDSVVRRKPIPPSAVSESDVDLGMFVKRTAGYGLRDGGGGQDMLATVGSDLSLGVEFFLGAAGGNTTRAVEGFRTSMSEVPDYMATVAGQLRSTPPAVRRWHQFASSNWSAFVDPWGLYCLMQSCGSDESMTGQVVAPSTGRVWVYDHCVAILRAKSGRNNDFGYGPLGTLFQRERESKRFVAFIRRAIAGLPSREQLSAKRWVETTLQRSSEPGRRGFQDWLARTKSVNGVVIASYAFALATMLGEQVGKQCDVSVDKIIGAHAYALWNKLLTYPDYEGLPGLIIAACGTRARWAEIPTLMSEIAGETVQDAGMLRMLSVPGGLVFWVSATDAGRGHKVKELSAKARCLKHQYRAGGFRTRPEATRLLLVVDGTFSRQDLEALKNAGWDELYYPDEMDELAKAIA